MENRKPVVGIQKDLIDKFQTFKKWEAYCKKMGYENPKLYWEKFNKEKVVLKKK